MWSRTETLSSSDSMSEKNEYEPAALPAQPAGHFYANFQAAGEGDGKVSEIAGNCRILPLDWRKMRGKSIFWPFFGMDTINCVLSMQIRTRKGKKFGKIRGKI